MKNEQLQSAVPVVKRRCNQKTAIQVNISLMYHWVLESKDVELLTPNEVYVLIVFLRLAIAEKKNYIQYKVDKLVKLLKLSVNPLLKAINGLEEKQLLRKVRDSEDSRAPMKYFFTLPSPPCDQERSCDTPMQSTVTTNADLKEILRIILFLNGHPLSLDRLIAITERSGSEIRDAMASLAADFKDQSLQIYETAAGFQMSSRPEFVEYAEKVAKTRPPLTETEREVLTIIFYTAPITREGIAKLRGVSPVESLNVLIKKKYVSVDFRKDVPPLFSPTVAGLSLFGMKDLSELPEREAMRKAAIDRYNLEGLP